MILLAKSEIRTMYVQHEPENRVCQRIGSCETDFASSLHEESSPPRMKIAQAIFTSASKVAKSRMALS
jgi:hypothetical protein